jgi:hypothetical protein
VGSTCWIQGSPPLDQRVRVSTCPSCGDAKTVNLDGSAVNNQLITGIHDFCLGDFAVG